MQLWLIKAYSKVVYVVDYVENNVEENVHDSLVTDDSLAAALS